MKYSIYFKGENVELHLETQIVGRIDCYKFDGTLERFSNVPNMTRLFGYENINYNQPYYLYPIDLKKSSKGEYQVLEDKNTHLRLRFLSGILEGEWIIRRLNTGQILFWKPITKEFVCPAKTMIDEVSSDIKQTVKQQFSSFENVSNDPFMFEGITAATGVWTGADLHTTLFPDYAIDKIGNRMKTLMKDLFVDFNHNENFAGGIDEVDLVNNKKIKYIAVKGHSNIEVPKGAGLSLQLDSSLVWDNTLNIWVLNDAIPEGVSIMTNNKPACKICWVK